MWVLGKIESIESSAHWYYLSCMRCAKKLSMVGNSLFCDKCNVSENSGSVRYKLIVSITDCTGVSVKILLWNREAVQLVGISAFDLKDKFEVNRNLFFLINIQFWL